jgi:hypothetical protein
VVDISAICSAEEIWHHREKKKITEEKAYIFQIINGRRIRKILSLTR